jgi:hypothetical protein
MTIVEENLTNTAADVTRDFEHLFGESEFETTSDRCLRMLAMHELEQNGPSSAARV